MVVLISPFFGTVFEIAQGKGTVLSPLFGNVKCKIDVGGYVTFTSKQFWEALLLEKGIREPRSLAI